MRKGLGLARLTAAVALVVALTTQAHAGDGTSLLRGLDTDDPRALAVGVAAIERAPTDPDLADVLFAAGRACEDRLYDPTRALALYERIVRELPDAGVSIAASRRIAMLRDLRAHPREAAELAQLKATADRLPVDDVIARADALSSAAWPGNSEAALWLGGWLCRTGRYAAGQLRYARVIDATGGVASDSARLALRDAAGCAIDGRDWRLAEQLAAQLPADDDIDRAVKADLFASAARGLLRDRLYTASWLGLVLAVGALLASLAEATLRGGWRAPPWRPPVEVLFLVPVAAVIALASFTAHRAIAPAVTRISIVGLALAWLSGAVLDVLRARDRAVRLRAVLHITACVVGVLSIGYIAMTRDGLLDMLTETVQFGPGA